MNTATLSHSTTNPGQTIFTIHTDVVTNWRRKVRNVRLIAREFYSRAEAETVLAGVRKSNPKAFIKNHAVH